MRAGADLSPLIRAAFAAPTLALLAACGSSGDTAGPLDPASPSPGTAASSLNMALLSHVDLNQLSLPASAEYQGLGL
jgi:hypothetical protein